MAAIAWPLVAHATQYESDFVADSEWELEALRERGDISHQSLDALVELLRSGVRLDQARAEDLHELPGLTWVDVDAILAGRRSPSPTFGEIPAELRRGERLRHLAAFLRPQDANAERLRGSLELASHYILGDRVVPPGLLRGRLRLATAGVDVGFAVVSSRQRLGALSWDPERHALVAQRPGHSVALPKWLLAWGDRKLSVLAGTFRIGFAERLTLDNTRRQTPDGFHPDETVQRDVELARFCADTAGADACDADGAGYAARDFRWQDGFRGLAASARDVQLGARTSVDLHAFGSLQARSIYQYDIVDRERCGESCRAPAVIESSSGTPLAYVTLPDAFDEVAAGGRAAVSVEGLGRIAITGYRATPRWRIAGAPLDFQQSSDYPSGGAFGAVGIDASARVGPWRLSAEAARSFDRLPDGGGGFGAVQRSVLSDAEGELELTLRYFDARFVNPYARPVSAPDELKGQRARNEAGVRVRYWREAALHWRFAGSADLSIAPETRSPWPTLAVSARSEYAGGSPLSLALWGSHTRLAGCTADEMSAARCGRERSRAGARVALAPLGPLSELSLQCAYGWARDASDEPWRQSLSAWLEASANVSSGLRLRVRTHYETADPSAWAASLEAGWSPAPLLSARSRYEARAWLETPTHRRNPEHRFRLELETRF